jgi:Ca-activated chloride channel family protein
MASEDFELRGQRANRLMVAKDVLEQFVSKRISDRIGLVAFAGKPYVAAPLTLDHDFLLQNLERLNLGTMEDGTAIGSALTAALNRLRELKSKSKIVILMTDGQNNAGKVPPLTAAEAAQALGVKVYTIGVGTRGTPPCHRWMLWPQALRPNSRRYR